MGEEQSEATLKLTVLSAEGLKDMRFMGKMKSFAVVWIDPRLKKSTTTLTSSTRNPVWNYELSFPLSFRILQNPNSCITIQILYPSSSPIHHERVIGSTILSLTEIRYDEEVFTLQLWRPSGRAYGLLRISARVECNLPFYTPAGCVTGIPVEVNTVTLPPLILNQTDTMESGSTHLVLPSAPPMPDGSNVLRSLLVGLVGGAVAVAAILLGTDAG